MHGLVETIDAGGFQAGFFELFDGIRLRFAKTFAAGVAARECVVGEKFNVRPPGLAVEVGGGRGLRRQSTDGEGKQKAKQETSAHFNSPQIALGV